MCMCMHTPLALDVHQSHEELFINQPRWLDREQVVPE